jgi:hypothetical protein
MMWSVLDQDIQGVRLCVVYTKREYPRQSSMMWSVLNPAVQDIRLCVVNSKPGYPRQDIIVCGVVFFSPQ